MFDQSMTTPGPARPSVLLLALLLISGCAGLTRHSVGVLDGNFTECPVAPRCVSSQATDDSHAVPVLQIASTPEQAWRAALETLAGMSRTTVVETEENYLRAEIVSPWHVYTDDFELLLRADEGIIHVRSTSRLGYYDFNVNRDRVEQLRTELAEQGVVEPLAQE